MASPVIADPFHRMKYMERHGSGLRKIVRETEKPPGYTAAYNPKIFSTATDFRVILKNVNYQLSQKNLVNDQVSEQDKSPDIPHTVLNLCIHLIAHGSEGAQITKARCCGWKSLFRQLSFYVLAAWFRSPAPVPA